MNDEQKLLIDLVRRVIRKENAAENSSLPHILREEIVRVMNLSKHHSVENIAAEAILDFYEVEDEEIRQKLEHEKMLAFFLDTNRNEVLSLVGKALGNANIDYMPLKGSIIKHFYPRDDLRSSCDIDVLVRESDITEAEKVICGIGGVPDGNGNHDRGFSFPGKVRLELHFSLFKESDKSGEIFKNVWERATRVDNNACEYAMTDEDFYLYTVAHAAKHFSHGGFGARTVADVFIWRKYHVMDEEYISEKAEKIGILKLMRATERLAEVWFGTGVHDSLSERLGDFVLDGAVYGTVEVGVAVSRGKILSKNNSGRTRNVKDAAIDGGTSAADVPSTGNAGGKRAKGKFRYLFKRVFLPYGEMKLLFPRLAKAPILLPFYWIKRAAIALFGKNRKRFTAQFRLNNRMSEEEINAIAAFYDELGML